MNPLCVCGVLTTVNRLMLNNQLKKSMTMSKRSLMSSLINKISVIILVNCSNHKGWKEYFLVIILR